MKNKTASLTIQKDSTIFRCFDCQQNLELPVERADPMPTLKPHPFEYFAHCPDCGIEIAEAPHMKNLYKAWLNQTGTKSPEISAKNLPDPSDPRRRFGALKHGLFAKKAKYFPAKVGKYPECDGCSYSNDCEDSGICLEISKIKMIVNRAFDSKDPERLQPLFEEIQADTFVVIQRMFRQVLADGTTLEVPVFGNSKDGPVRLTHEGGAEIKEITAHPLLKHIADFLQKNGLSLSDLQMTPKTQVDKSIAMGNLAAGKEERLTLQQMHDERKDMMQDFLSGMSKSTTNRENDPIYQDHKEESG